MNTAPRSYAWLAEQLDIPVVGPETAEGKMYTRAEWILRAVLRTSCEVVWEMWEGLRR